MNLSSLKLFFEEIKEKVKERRQFFQLSFYFLTVLLVFITSNKIKQPTNTLPKAASESGNEWISPKKGVGGPVTNETSSLAKVSWYYNWYFQPLGNLWQTQNGAKFVPLFRSNPPSINWCQAVDYLSNLDYRMGVVCNNNYCQKGNYYLIGNEPFEPGQDLRPGTNDPVYDAVNCYGEIMKKIRSFDSTAKFIILGIAYPESDRLEKTLQFIQRWKTHWQTKDPAMADLPAIIKGWHLHTYSNYLDCPTSDARVANFKTAVDNQIQAVYGHQVDGEEFWVTEMGSLTSPDNPTETQKQQFSRLMECLVNAYENSPIVNRYAWFYHGCLPIPNQYCETQWQRTSLFLPNSDNTGYIISYLGQKYATLAYSASGSPTPTPTVPPCQGPAENAAESTSIYSSNEITPASGWSYGAAAKFNPSFSGKLDKVEMYVSGNGRVEVMVNDSSGVQIGEIVGKNINQTQNWATFDFSNEGMVYSGRQYSLNFRVTSGAVTFYRGNTWFWAYRVWVRRCETPTSTPTPPPSLSPTSTPTIPPSSNSCNLVGNPILDQEQNQHSISNQLTSNWGYGGKLNFSPKNLGKADRIELYASGNGEIEAKIIDANNNNLTETVRKRVSSEGWLNFDFGTEPILTPGINYEITFRAASGTVYLWRGNYWAWAYRLYLKPCINNSPNPSPTNIPFITPTPTPPTSVSPTPTQTPVNSPPIITSPSQDYLPLGYVGKQYNFYFEGYDLNVGDNLEMKVHGTFPGLSLTTCSQSTADNKKIIKCLFSGIPSTAGKYNGHVHLLDGINDITKNFYLNIQ